MVVFIGTIQCLCSDAAAKPALASHAHDKHSCCDKPQSSAPEKPQHCRHCEQSVTTPLTAAAKAMPAKSLLPLLDIAPLDQPSIAIFATPTFVDNSSISPPLLTLLSLH